MECSMGFENCFCCSPSGKAPNPAERGDTVKVEFEATYRGNPLAGDEKIMLNVKTPDGVRETWVPGGAKVTVVRKAVPEEPVHGSVVEFPDGAVYAHWAKPTEGFTGGYDWIGINDKTTCRSIEWKTIVARHGNRWTPWARNPFADLTFAF